MSLNKINFSDGIRPEEIQENFEMLQEQIKRERIGVGGYGIASGFEVTPIINDSKFAIHLSAASIIDKDGSELFIPECEIDIEKPELFDSLEYHTVNASNQITLKQVPYSIDRTKPSEYLPSFDPSLSGIYINYRNNSRSVDDYIRVSNIEGYTLTLTGIIQRDIAVRYKYSANRIDTLYLKNDNTVGILKGTTSTTPSKPYIPSDGKLIIAYLSIESEYLDDNTLEPKAYLYVKDDMRSLRNLYTDKDNNLYICGTPFDDLQIIHLKEPKNPKENTLWLNTTTNTLSYWKSTDDYVYYNKIIVDTDFVVNDNANRDFATYMDFMLDENELQVYLNGSKLIKDIHYCELHNELPTYEQNIPSKTEGNSFRILETVESGIKLKPGDEIMYMIRYKDSHFMWVPINKMNYINAKDSKVYCTNDYMPNNIEGYFDSEIANQMGEFTVTNYDQNGNKIESNLYNQYKYKYQYFFFDREKDLNLLYTPGKKELSLLINQMLLHEDQFEEITAYDLLTSINPYTGGSWDDYIGTSYTSNYTISHNNGDIPKSVARVAAVYYGWTREELEKLAQDFDNTGIGFKLKEPLDSGWNAESHPYYMEDGSNDIYIEAIVERRICDSAIKRKFQRSSTFVAENTIIVNEQADSYIVDLENTYYRYNEKQLEVFINGIKLSEYSTTNRHPELIEQYGYYLPKIVEVNNNGVMDILEEEVIVKPIDNSEDENNIDQSYFERKRSAVCKSFKINRHLNPGDVITYRITTNIYSYDHINNILDDLESRLDCGVDTITAIYENIAAYKNEINEKIESVQNQIFKINEEEKSKEYLTTKSVLTESNMPSSIIEKTIVDLDHINTSLIFKEEQLNYSVSSIRAYDYLTIVRRNKNTLIDSFLIRDVDYTVSDTISSDGKWISTTLSFVSESAESWNAGDRILISGIKLGKIGR